MKVLIKFIGFIGDNLFASSIPKKLKSEGFTHVDVQLSIAQPLELIKLNPYIDNVFLYESINCNEYDKVFSLHPIHRNETPTIQFQKQCNVVNPSSEYEINTNSSIDSYVSPLLKHTFQEKILISYMMNWEEKSFGFTKEEYERGIDVPNLGYGGRRRNIDYIISQLKLDDRFHLIPVGMPVGFNQKEITLDGVTNYSLTASIIKACDWFIGGEGGLANLAAGVGTPTIITGDYIHQLYGWNGVIEKNKEPKLGPKYYFEKNHYTLDPYLTDSEVVSKIVNFIK